MGNLLTRRAIALLLAIALAIVAVVAVLNYTRGVESEAAQDADLVRAYYATTRIEPGTLADTAIQLGNIEERQIPRSLLAENAVTDLTQISGRTVQDVILTGDQVVNGRFSAPGQSASVLTIPPDHQAVSFSVGIEPGVAGFVREGDFVSVIAVANAPVPGQTTTTTDEDGNTTTQQASEQRARYVLQNVEVLAIGRRTPPTEENPNGGTAQQEGGLLLTVALLPEDAERLVFGQTNASLWLTLPPDDEREPVDTDGVTIDEFFTSFG